MAAGDAPITVKEILTLSSIGINEQFITFTNVTMESEKYICVRETFPQNSVVIVDMSMPLQPLRRPITADSVIMNPNARILALKASLPGTTHDHLQVFNIETKAKMKSCQMPEQVSFWKWITPKLLGLVTQTSVYHWSFEGDSEPVKMFDRTANLANNQIINYRCDPSEKWLVLIGVAPGSPERPQLVKGNMQIFSVDLQHSQAIEAYAASFSSFKVPGNENPSILLSFATKSINAGQVTSKLHVIELGAHPERSAFTRKQADLFFPPDFADDFPVAIQISHRYSLIHVITKLGLLYVYDLETATSVYRNKISPDPIFLASDASSVGGFYAINQRGQVLLATVNESTIVSFVSGQLNNLELAVDLAERGNLPGAVNLVVQRFQELFAQNKYKEAAELAAESPLGILRTPDTITKFQSVSVQGGTPPILQYFGTLLTKGKLNAFESFKLSQLVSIKTKKNLSQLVMNQNKNLVDNWLAKDKLECAEKLGDVVKTLDNDLAERIYIEAKATSKFFQNLFAQNKYKEAVELAVEYQGILRTPDTVAKFQSVPVQGGQTPPLLQYFLNLLTKGKLDAFESLEFSRLVVYQNKKNLLDNSLAEDKLECTEELGDLVKTADSDLASKIYIKAGATSKVVEAFAERREFSKLLIYSKQVGYTAPDFQFLLQTILQSDSRGAVKFALMMSRMEGGCPLDYNTITDLFLQRKLIREATTFLLDVLKPNLPEHAFLQTKVLEINIVTFPSVVDAILANGMFSYYDRVRISQLCKEAGLYVELYR